MPLLGKMVHSWDYGIYRVKLDGEQIAEQDLYDPNVTPVEHKWGMRKLAPGVHTLRFECAGKSPKSTGYYLGFGALVGRTPVYSRAPSVNLRTLQKTR